MEKTLTRTVGEGTAWLSLSGIFKKIVGLATTFFVLRYLSVYGYGLVTLTLSIVPILGFFLLPGITDVIVADMGVEKSKGNLGGVRNLFSGYIKLQIILSLIAWAVVFWGADIIAIFYEGQIHTLLRIISFSFLLHLFRTAIGVVFSVYLQFLAQSIYSFLEVLFKFILIIIFLVVLGWGPVGVVAAGVIGQLAAILALVPQFIKSYLRFAKAPIIKKTPFWNLVRFHGKWSLFASYIGQFSSKARLWIIKFLIGTEAVALYSVAESLVGHCMSPVPISQVVRPIIPQYVHDRGLFFRITHKAMKYQFLSFVAMGIIAFFAFPPIIVWLFPNYISSMGLFKIMLLALIPSSIASVFRPMFFALKAQKKLFKAVIIRATSVVVLAPTLILLFGVRGAAFEFIVTLAIFTFWRYNILSKLLPGFSVRLREIMSIDEYDKLIISKVKQKITGVFSSQQI